MSEDVPVPTFNEEEQMQETFISDFDRDLCEVLGIDHYYAEISKIQDSFENELMWQYVEQERQQPEMTDPL